MTSKTDEKQGGHGGGRYPMFDERLEVFATKINKSTRTNVKRLADKLNISQSDLTRRALDQFIKQTAAAIGVEVEPEIAKRTKQVG